jgi:hypothetical protein
MTTTSDKYSSPGSSGQRALNSIQNVIARATRNNPSRTVKATPTWEEIEIKAYEIWLSRGREQGNDQEHWFEAERQLRQG